MTDNRSPSRSSQGKRMAQVDHNAAVTLNSVVTATVREKHADRGFVIVRFGDRESCSALIALTECELGDAATKEAAFEALKLGTVVTGTIVRKEAGNLTRLRMSVRQYKQDQFGRERRESQERDRSDRATELSALQAANADAGVVGGLITSKENYGVFVQVTPKWRALLPAAEMCGERSQRNARLDALEIGQYVEGVLTVKDGNGKPLLSLSEAAASASKREAAQRKQAAVAAALQAQTLASLVPGFEFTASVWFDLGPEGTDGTDAGLILDHNGVHVWLPEKELGEDGKHRRDSFNKVRVRFVGFDAAHEDMPYVERVR
jgi:ribosomal protein S1